MAVQIVVGGDAEALEDREYPAFFAALLNDPDTARRMIREGADVNQLINSEHLSPLLHTLQNQAYQMARFLIENGADVLHRNSFGMTPLHKVCSITSPAATEEERYEMCKLLLEKGAECNSRNNHGNTQLHYALIHRGLKVVQLLLDHGADITALDGYKATALHFAASSRIMDLIDFVLNQGFDIECSSNYGWSPLHCAAVGGNSGGCEYLLKRGANVNRKSNPPYECTPLTSAVKCRHRFRRDPSKTVELLLDYGANVGDKEGGRSVLEIAASHHGAILRQNLQPYTADIKFILMRHVAKMNYTNSSINEYDRQTIESNNFYKGYYEFCADELERMKKRKICNAVSVFNILVDSDEAVSRYAKDEGLVRALENEDLDNEFHIYFPWLKKKCYAAIGRQRL